MLLVRLGRFRFRVPGFLWRRLVAAEARRSGEGLGWFSADHGAVRDFTVTEIANTGRPVTDGQIAAGTGIAEDRVAGILKQLERAKSFLYRSDGASVDWAYPVTAAETPHRIRLDSGERFFAA